MYAKVQDFRNLDDEGDDAPPIQAKTYDAGMAYYQAYKGLYEQLSTVKDDEEQFQRDLLAGEAGSSTTASTHRKVVGVIEDGGRAAQRSIVGDSPAGRSFDHSEMEEKKRATRTSSTKFRKQQSSSDLSSSSSATNKAGASRKKE